MHSIAVASILAAAATLTAAAPSVDRRGAYYVCWNNGFRGDCSVDPCALSWCPDYKPHTYEPAAKSSTPEPVSVPVATKQWYVCANNNFRGECTVDPCAISWCPDYKPYTYEPKVAKRQSDPTVCAPGTGYFQSCSNGFRGCCKSDACGSPTGWCPDNKLKERTPEPAPAPASDPTVCAPGTGYFQSCSNGFRGCCKSDACGSVTGWCPDHQLKERTPEPAPAPASDPTVCAPGTGFFQSCSNGFRGCCKTDACSPSGWCADYKKGTYEPVSAPAPAPAPAPVKPVTPAPTPATVPVPVDGVCPAGTGFFQVCANGFKGCCKSDACTIGYCPN